MSSFNLEQQKPEKGYIVIEKIIERQPNAKGNLPGMKILDSESREHYLNFSDFPNLTVKEWNRIQAGDKIRITIEKRAINPEILPGKFRNLPQFTEQFKTYMQEISGNSGPFFYIFWVCEYCRTMGAVKYLDGEDELITGKKVEEDHWAAAKDGCNRQSFKLYDHRGNFLEAPTQIIRLSYHQKTNCTV